MQNEGLHKAVNNLAGNIPGAFCFVLDDENNQFHYTSAEEPIFEQLILEMKSEKEFSEMFAESTHNYLQMECAHNGRIIFIKKLAAKLLFGICVTENKDLIAETKKVMRTEFPVE